MGVLGREREGSAAGAAPKGNWSPWRPRVLSATWRGGRERSGGSRRDVFVELARGMAMAAAATASGSVRAFGRCIPSDKGEPCRARQLSFHLPSLSLGFPDVTVAKKALL